MGVDSLNNSAPNPSFDAVPNTAETMLNGVESADGTGKRAIEAVNSATEFLKAHPDKMDQFSDAMASFGRGMGRRNEVAHDAQARILDMASSRMGGEKYAGSNVDTRIAGVMSKLAEGLKVGTIKPEDVGVMITLAQLDDQIAHAQADAYSSTGKGVVSGELPEQKEANGQK